VKHSAAQPDVFIVGGGPAGLAAAICARQKGFQVLVADRACPPIDKVCGEGLMPNAVAELHQLGVQWGTGEVFPFRGIRFLDGQTGMTTEAEFSHGAGLGVRRTALHGRLLQRAIETGVTFTWGAQVASPGGGRMTCNGGEVRSRWIIGADGIQSQVREWAGLQPARRERKRFGFRQHFRAAPWTDFVEVYWGRSCQLAVTPTGPEEIGVAVISRNSRMRVQSALREVPILAARLDGAAPTTRERGAPCGLRRLPSVCGGGFALIGDASGSVDPITGEGLGLAFSQAMALGDALRDGDLHGYQAAHERICKATRWLSRVILAMDGNAWLRRRAMRTLAAEPHLFARLLNFTVQERAQPVLGVGDAFRLGWGLARSSWQP
jgi:flavin-dependent dehydrogenase